MSLSLIAAVLCLVFHVSAPTIPSVSSAVSASQPKIKLIALTFDDGPNAKITPLILATLKQYQIRATFFVIGLEARKHEELIKQEIEAGHEIGNHTLSHRRLTSLGDEKVLGQMAGAQKIIGDKTAVRFIRPPYGSHNARIDRLAKRLGLQMITWTLASNDWRGYPASRLTQQIVTLARPNDIILFHDIHSNAAEALPKIIQGLKERGFTFATVNELLQPGVKLPCGIEVH
ncbi:MAG: polysaccharide deacetylase family protein [Patescibacteria group bacterium]|jgi:peptidoglycan/xylan/chitin deacetylase (PgdA/CDA1 family)